MAMNLDTGVMISEVIKRHVITLDVGISMRGDPEYQVTWYNGKRWEHATYRRLNDAVATYKMIQRMLV